MKLNEIISQVPVKAAGVQFQEAGGVPANYGSAIARAMTQAGQDIEQTGNEAFRVAMRADAQRRNLEEANQAASLITGAELQLKQHRANVVQGQDYNGFVESYQTGANEIIGSTLKQTNNPNVKAAVKLRLTRAAGNEVIDVQQDALKKFKDVQTATLDQNLVNISQLASTATKPEDMGNYIGLGIGNIKAMVAGGLITSVEGGKRQREFLGDLEMVKARQDMLENPERFISEIERYQYLDPVKRQSLVESAGKEVERRNAKQERDRKAQEAQEAKDLKVWQSQNSMQLQGMLRGGKANAGTVLEWGASGKINEADQRFYLSYIDTKSRSDSATADRNQREAQHQQDRNERNAVGTLKTFLLDNDASPEQMMGVAKSGKFSGHVSGQIAEMAMTHQRQTKGDIKEDRTELRARFNRMEDEAKDQFVGVAAGVNPKLDAEVEQLWGQFREHARSRSTAWGEGQGTLDDPFEVKRQIIDEYKDRLRSLIKVQSTATFNAIPERYQPALDDKGNFDFASIQAKVAELKQQGLKGLISPAEVRVQAERLRELSRARAAADRNDATTPGAPKK